MMHCRLLLVSTLVLTGLSTAQAANLVANGGFETYTGAFGSDNAAILFPGTTALSSWTIFGADIDVIRMPNPYNLTPSEGANFIDLTGSTDGGGPKGLTQTVSGFSVGSTYLLSFDLGIRNGFCSLGDDCVGPIRVSASIGGVTQLFTHDSTEPGNVWATYGYTFTATSGSLPLTLTGVAGFRYIGLDNVSVSAVPEPSAALYILLGLPLVAGAVRRTRRCAVCEEVRAATDNPLLSRIAA